MTRLSPPEDGAQSGPWDAQKAESRVLLDLAADRLVRDRTDASDSFLNLAHRHGLIPLLATSDRSEFRKTAWAPFVRWSSRQAVMKHNLHRLLETFARHDIPATVLKGPYLAEFAYRASQHRPFTDVDVLIQPEDLEGALDLLGQDPAIFSIPRKKPRADKREIPVTDRSTGIRFNLDLHWDLFSYTQLRGSASGATAAAWAQSSGPVDSTLGPIWQLPTAARMAFLCAHALLDHRFRLILFRDLLEIAQTPFPWSDLADFAGRWRLRSTTYLSLLIAQRALGAPIPGTALEELRPPSLIVRSLERMLPHTDLVRFDGHRAHPLNLAVVLLHDDLSGRASLLVRAPAAFPGWRQRVGLGRPNLLPERRSIAIVVTTDRRRGAEVFGERLAGALRSRGWDVSLLALSHDPGGPWVAATPVSPQSPEQLGRLDLRVVRALRVALKDGRARAVLANGSSTLQYALAAAASISTRPKVVYSSIGEPLYWIRGRARRALQLGLLSRTDAILAVSESTKRQLVEGVGVDSSEIEVAPTGVPSSFFQIAAPGSDHPELRLLFLGSLSREKNPFAAIEVAERLAQSRPVEMRFVGEGSLQPELQARAVGATTSIGFGGSVADVSPHLAWADLLILSSETEGLPGVVLEAAAAGLPTVSFDVGGVSETIVDGVTGELVPPGDIAAFASAIDRLSSDRTRLAEMGKQARSFVAERFNLEQAVDRYEKTLADLMR